MMDYLTSNCKQQCFSVGSGASLSDDRFLSMMKIEYSKIGIFLDYDCDWSKHLLNQVSSNLHT